MGNSVLFEVTLYPLYVASVVTLPEKGACNPGRRPYNDLNKVRRDVMRQLAQFPALSGDGYCSSYIVM